MIGRLAAGWLASYLGHVLLTVAVDGAVEILVVADMVAPALPSAVVFCSRPPRVAAATAEVYSVRVAHGALLVGPRRKALLFCCSGGDGQLHRI